MSTNLLPLEIIEAIFRFLPTKSLGRFKSVSKTLNSLISHPRFIKTHLHQTHHTLKLMLKSPEEPLYSLDISQLLQCLNHSHGLPAIPATELGPIGSPPMSCKLIWDSCNGLVLAEDQSDTLLVMNPTTRDLWRVPRSKRFLHGFPRLGMVSFTYGFGYDSTADDYKVVAVSFSYETDPADSVCTNTFVSVYSLRNNSWTESLNSPYHRDLHHFIFSSVVVNESFHWSASKSRIVSFNIATHEFSEMQLPDSITEHESVCSRLLVVGGNLGFVGVGVSNELWVMEEYGVAESWTRVCSLGVDMESIKPRCLDSRWILLGNCRAKHDDDEVFVYDMDERTCRNVRIVGGPSRFICVGGANVETIYNETLYVETLESPKRIITPP